MANDETSVWGEAPGAEQKSAAEKRFLEQLHQRKVVSEALKNGTLCALPGKDGYADTSPAVNITTGTRYHGATLLYLKEHQRQNGFPSAEYMTQEAIQKAGIPIRKGEHGVQISFQTKSDAGDWETKNARLFNIAQSVKPWDLKKYAEGVMATKQEERQEFLKKNFGESYKPFERKEQKPGPEVACSSTEPEKYLGEYLAAVSMGSKFKATPEQGAEFAKNMNEQIFKKTFNEKLGEERTDPFKLSKICNSAGDVCKEVIKEARKRENPVPERNHEQEQTQKRGGFKR